ncbi:MAG: Ig-like domain-containing protein, partial [Clostridiales bacterium]|nr:Ig-like domain-containing protein [Clostridiales bacterium]
MYKLTYWLFGMLLIGISIGAVLLLNNIREISWQAAENAVCEAMVADIGGVDTNSAFRFVFEGDIRANAVRRYLTVEPSLELNFHQGISAHEVLAIPVEPLRPETLYRFSLSTERETLAWAFQTKQELFVQHTSPAHTATAVSTSTALEIYFNQSLPVDMSALPYYAAINPAIEGSFEQEGNCLRFMPETSLAANTVYRLSFAAGLPTQGSDIALAKDFTFAFETANMDNSAPRISWYILSEPSYLPSRAPVFSFCFVGAHNRDEMQINAALYRYADANSYALELLERESSAPMWSIQGQ